MSATNCVANRITIQKIRDIHRSDRDSGGGEFSGLLILLSYDIGEFQTPHNFCDWTVAWVRQLLRQENAEFTRNECRNEGISPREISHRVQYTLNFSSSVHHLTSSLTFYLPNHQNNQLCLKNYLVSLAVFKWRETLWYNSSPNGPFSLKHQRRLYFIFIRFFLSCLNTNSTIVTATPKSKVHLAKPWS